jgi:hypothetical protein
MNLNAKSMDEKGFESIFEFKTLWTYPVPKGAPVVRVGSVWLSGRNQVGLGRVNLHVVFFQIVDRFWLDWRSFDLGSGRVKSGSGRVISGRIGQISRVGSGSATSKHHTIAECDSYLPAYLREMIILLNLLKIKFTFIVINVVLFF